MWESVGRGRDSSIWESPAWTEPDGAVPREERGEGERQRRVRGTRCSSQEAQRYKESEWVTKMVGLCREGSPAPGLESSVGGQHASPEGSVTGRD